MKEALYLEDSYLKEFEAEVTSVTDDKFVVLNQTAFYPKSGGQLNDEGTLTNEAGEEFKVVFTGKFSGKISHETDKPGLKVGDKVKGKLDWERRYTMMRMHTAAHVLCSIYSKDAGALITGNQLGIEKTRIDFSLDNMDKEKMIAYLGKANELINLNKPIKSFYLSREDALKLPDISKLAKGLPDLQEFRIIEIEDIDTQADGGTHVKSTEEVGELEFLKVENKGKNNRRVYFKLK
ncbi:alanyl-tRNA editing protein [Candidatus Woesearchaeota archaeon]|jgi:misacylated tRNA(Ala) deacylase|nr:alanyl-tRNA editing protein [Candidatus Woesearchaeota archaeon]MBT3538108.1 alanyl-tRNA editing protein [Candidatus Woesearchaeota archaeon]MBT4697533.1 alanyl-tRNA editing protein [Candidatus Woesearchaeota archaeon]MBT4717380.1 alanyl-tRNA editing protein [Candidatus Woesearchaeota archaeon]MBT7105777.1 alanyl-tRNA editing protein [Candidatus Woesearchaeota archaeon]